MFTISYKKNFRLDRPFRLASSTPPDLDDDEYDDDGYDDDGDEYHADDEADNDGDNDYGDD